MMRILCAACLLGLLSASLAGFAQDKEPKELSFAEQLSLQLEATKLKAEAILLYQRGQLAEVVDKLRQTLEMRQKLYPAAKYPDGHPDLALSLSNLTSEERR